MVALTSVLAETIHELPFLTFIYCILCVSVLVTYPCRQLYHLNLSEISKTFTLLRARSYFITTLNSWLSFQRRYPPPQHTHKTTTHLALQEGYQVLDNKEEAKPRCDSSTTVSWDPHQGPASLTHFVFMWHSYSHTHWLLLCVIIYCGLCFILEIQK